MKMLKMIVKENEKGLTLVRVISDENILWIPDKARNSKGIDKKIVDIEENAFDGLLCSRLVLPNFVEVIHHGVFQNCPNLRDIEMPRCLRTVDSFAFKDCQKLNKLYFSCYLKKVSKNAFYNCGSCEIISTKYLSREKKRMIFDKNAFTNMLAGKEV